VNVKLHVFKNDGTSKEVPLKPGSYLIGRGKEAALRIPLPSVSREHCVLTVDGAGLKVKDLGSSNGTFLNRERVTEATLSAGDSLAVGDLTIVVQIDGKPASIHAPGAPASGGSSMMDTPSTPVSAPAAPAPRPAAAPAPRPAPPKPAPLVEEDEDADTANDLGTLPQGLSNDESSIFDFDFDFEDEDRPKL
jgi:pSer/pThr/pTyr-binding forkhead associated (FHA) protein